MNLKKNSEIARRIGKNYLFFTFHYLFFTFFWHYLELFTPARVSEDILIHRNNLGSTSAAADAITTPFDVEVM